METLGHKDIVVYDVLAPRSIEDIKSSYPDEWILLGNPEKDEYNRTTSGVVLYHSPDKRELILIRPLHSFSAKIQIKNETNILRLFFASLVIIRM